MSTSTSTRSAGPGGPDSGRTSTSAARIVGSWALVAVPLVYGLVETIRKAATLFTG